MIIILSKSKTEDTTEKVIDWLNHFGCSWKRINGSDLENYPLQINLNNDINTIKIGETKIDGNQVKVVWFRRWQDKIPYKQLKAHNDDTSYEVKAHYRLERKKLRQLLFDEFENAYWLSKPNDEFHKFYVLRKAKQTGLIIPNTFIVNNKTDLEQVLDEQEIPLITKCISDAPIYYSDKNAFMLYTKELKMKDIKLEKEFFFPTLLQEKIEKEYELRIFFLDGIFYSMAIFSQTDDKTKDDFRQYNFEKPNRNVPYKLPSDIENKIILLMYKLKLTTGSIDMIKSMDGKYIFLEVNPNGQFGMTSSPCNYNLEKKVAEFLNAKHNEQT